MAMGDVDDEARKELGIAHKRLIDFVKGNFYEDPMAEEEDRDVWAGFEARLDVLIDAARKAGPPPVRKLP
jgi:hypothetical protein